MQRTRSSVRQDPGSRERRAGSPSEDTAELKSVVELAHLEFEAIQAVAVYREAIDPSQSRSSIFSSVMLVCTKQNSRSGCSRRSSACLFIEARPSTQMSLTAMRSMIQQ